MDTNNKIELVVFDWAGTTVDYGSSAPSEVFDRVFSAAGLHLTKEEINRPMGLEKKAHIRELLSCESGRNQWQGQYGRPWYEEDVDALYRKFEDTLHQVVAERSDPMEGVVETVAALRKAGLKIGSTTGYNDWMMQKVLPRAAKFVRGFATFLRNIPALLWAFILFSSLGIGTGVGFVALCITSFAFLVRAFVEIMEDVSQDCVESLLTVGASFPQRVSQAILPSCLSGFLSWFLYSVEVNIRASTIVGMVGGGGVGLTLFSYIKSFQYDVVLSIILLIAVMVIAVDQITNKLRKELLK